VWLSIPGEIEIAACGDFNFLPGERDLGWPSRAADNKYTRRRAKSAFIYSSFLSCPVYVYPPTIENTRILNGMEKPDRLCRYLRGVFIADTKATIKMLIDWWVARKILGILIALWYMSGSRAWINPRLGCQHACRNLEISGIFKCGVYIPDC